jgi:hypothetical protein
MLWFSLSWLAYGAEVQGAPFVDPPAVQRMEGARKVLITHIGWMRITPKMIDESDWNRYSRPLRPEDAAALLRNVEKTVRLDKAPTLQRCNFAPGFQISFFDAEDKISETLLICLNCDVLAVGNRSKLGNVILDPRPAAASTPFGLPAIYGEARPYKAELVTMLRKYFPEEIEQWERRK